MKIAILSLGRVGLPTAVIFASKGFNVIGVDVDEYKVKATNDGRCYMQEPKLGVLLKRVVMKGKLKASTDVYAATHEADVVIIAVPTPVNKGIVDLSYLKNALESIRVNLHEGELVVIESTVPPNTTTGFAVPLLEKSGLKVEKEFYLAHIPERIAPGRAVEELVNIPRVVGGVGPKSTKKAMEVYAKVNSNIHPTNATTAEFVKLIENTFRDINIAYANLLALFAEHIGVDIYEAIKLANAHPRVNIHFPGAGVGGPCLTKDPYMLAGLMPDLWYVGLISMARKINEYMPYHVVNLIEKFLRDEKLEIAKASIAVLGTAYKGGVDDTRESPAETVIKELLKKSAQIKVYDPYTSETFGAAPTHRVEDAVDQVDVIVIMTDHPEFKKLNLSKIAPLVRRKAIVDGRRVIEPYEAYKYGFKYYGIGYGGTFKI
ncbi:MAG: nucleotide sugar dehydrogenase [Candidatus Bathyarchaeia archaeon]